MFKFKKITKAAFFVAFFTFSFQSPILLSAIDQTTWERIGVYDERTYYLNHATSRHSGYRIQIWALTQLKEPAFTTRGRSYVSKKSLLEVDCHKKTLMILLDTWHPKPWGEGEPVFESDHSDMKPGIVQAQSPSEAILRGACGRR